jgi:hypothetical protein
MTYRFYHLNALRQILRRSTEVECDHDEMALAVASAQNGAHEAVEVWSHRRLVGRVPHAGIQHPPPPQTSLRPIVPDGWG